MIDCLKVDNASFRALATVQDRLRWDCLIEGRLPSMYIEVIRPMLKESGTRVFWQRLY